MKKVMIVSETVMDGVGKHIVDVIAHVDKSKYQLMVCHSHERRDYRFNQAMAKYKGCVTFVEIKHLVREISPKQDILAYKELKRQIEAFKPDIVHCHSSKAGVVGRLAAKGSGIKRIYYTPHAYAAQNDRISPKKKWFYIQIEKILGQFFTSLTLNVSEGERDFAVSHGITSRDKSKVIYNCVEDIEVDSHSLEYVRQHLEIHEPFVVGNVARLSVQKNPELFIEIAKQILKIRDDVCFIWIGQGEKCDEVTTQIQAQGLSDKIRFLGHREMIEAYYEVMTLYLSTALYEGLPYTLVEACRAGIPIVASDVIGNNEVVKAGVNGDLFSLAHPTEAVESILSIIDDDTKRYAMGKKSRETFKNTFSIDKMIEAYHELYA